MRVQSRSTHDPRAFATIITQTKNVDAFQSFAEAEFYFKINSFAREHGRLRREAADAGAARAVDVPDIGGYALLAVLRYYRIGWRGAGVLGCCYERRCQ